MPLSSLEMGLEKNDNLIDMSMLIIIQGCLLSMNSRENR